MNPITGVIQKDQHLVSGGQRRPQYADCIADHPDHWQSALNQAVDEPLRLFNWDCVEHTDKLRDNPLAHCDHGCGVHEIWIDVTPHVPYTAVVADLIQRYQHSRDLDPYRARNASIALFESLAGIKHIGRFGRLRREEAVDMTAENRVDDLT